MDIKVIPTYDFTKELKRLSKKHPGILADISTLSKQLKETPNMGTDLGGNFYKVRLAVSGTNKGKSGGARIITYVLLIAEIVYLVELYLKSDNDSVVLNKIIERLKNDGII